MTDQAVQDADREGRCRRAVWSGTNHDLTSPDYDAQTGTADAAARPETLTSHVTQDENITK